MITSNLLDNNLGNQIKKADRKRLGKLFKYLLPAFCWMLLILLLTGLPGYNFPSNELFSTDKVIHFGLYFLLSFLLMQAFHKQHTLPALRFESGFYTLLIGIFYSGLTEILQGLVFVQRSADLKDYLANVLGCIAGWLFFKILILKK